MAQKSSWSKSVKNALWIARFLRLNYESQTFHPWVHKILTPSTPHHGDFEKITMLVEGEHAISSRYSGHLRVGRGKRAFGFFLTFLLFLVMLTLAAGLLGAIVSLFVADDQSLWPWMILGSFVWIVITVRVIKKRTLQRIRVR